LEKVEKRSQLDILRYLVTTIPNTSVQGIVIQLTDRKDSSYVIVIIMGFVVGKLRQIKVMLSKAEYPIVRTTYTQRLAVSCSGDLIRDDDIFILKKPHISIYDTFITPIMS
jgi:NMD protein affecting ribosome stability and mRNA decay